MGVKQIPFNSNKAAETVALFIDLMLILGLEVTRSMSVLTGSDCISLYGETTWVGGGGGWNGSDKPEGYCAGLSLDDEDKPPSFSMPAKKKKAPIGGDASERGVYSPHFVTGGFCCRTKAGRSHWYLENIDAERNSALSLHFSEYTVVLLCLSLCE